MPRPLFLFFVVLPFNLFAQHSVRLPQKVCSTLHKVHEFSYNDQVVEEVKEHLEEGFSAFFNTLRFRKARKALKRVQELWVEGRPSILRAGLSVKVMRGLIVLARVCLLQKDRACVERTLGLLLHDFGEVFLKDPYLSPDIAQIVPEFRKVEVKITTPEACEGYLSGVPLKNGRALVEPGAHVLFLRCGEVIWVQELDVKERMEVRVNPELEGFLDRLGSCEFQGLSTDEVNRVCDGLAFVDPSQEMCQVDGAMWTRRGGSWVPPRPKKTVRIVHPLPSARTKRVRVLPIVLGSLGVAALGTGIALNVMANQTTDRINSGEVLFDRRKTLVISAWTSYGAAAACLVSAVVLWGIQGFTYEEPVGLVFQPAGVSLMGRF